MNREFIPFSSRLHNNPTKYEYWWEILQDAWYGRGLEADSGINEEEQGDDAPETTQEVEEEETEEVQGTESDEDGTDSEPEQKESGRYTAKEEIKLFAKYT